MARPDQTLREGNRGDTKRLFFPASGFPHGIQLIFKKYDYSDLTLGVGANKTGRRSDFTSATETGLLAVELPMPSTLTDATGLNINGFERSFLESFIADTLAPAFEGNFSDIGSELMALGEAGMKGAIDTVFGDKAKTPGQEKVAGQASRIASFMGANAINSFSSGLGKALGASRGTAINPQSTLSFEGVQLRAFSFDWTLYPESKAEAEAIKKIIRSIKRNILPTVQSVTGASKDGVAGVEGSLSGNTLARAFLTYPAVVSINLLGIDESHFLRFKPCMCDNITIDYGASGEIIIAEGGVPQGVKLSMSFKELEIQTAEDYAEPKDGDGK
jgi:hypothetical protein